MVIHSINLIKKYNLFIFFVAVLNFFSIALDGQLTVQEVRDQTWKEDALFALAERYMMYKKSYVLAGSNSYETDLYWKFYELNKFPFGAGMHKLKEELTSNIIVFDSIICEIEQNTHGSNPELLLPAAYYIFKDGAISKLLWFDADDLNISKLDWTEDEYEKMYSKSITKTDDVFFSLLIFTKIYPDWKFEINKIVINSH